MGIADNIKDLYFSLEDKYYSVINKLRLHAIVGPIDKIVPSFPLLTGLIILLLVIAAVFILFEFQSGTATLTVSVNDDSGQPVEGAIVRLHGLEGELSERTDSEGKAVFEEIPFNSQIRIEVGKGDYKTETIDLVVDETEKLVTVEIESTLPLPSLQRIEFVGPAGNKLVGVELQLEFECSSGARLEQSTFTIDSGEIEIMPPRGCGNLTVNVVAPSYKTRPYIVSNGGGVIQLESEDLTLGGIVFTVRDNESNAALEGMRVSIYNSLGGATGDVQYTNWGEASFQLPAGRYFATVEDLELDYAQKRVDFQAVAETTKNIEVKLSKSLKAILNFTVVDAASGEELEGAEVFLRKEDGTLVGAKTTAEDNLTVSFPLEHSGVYKYQASKDNYLPSDENSVDISGYSFGEDVDITIELRRCTPSTCGVVMVRVVDEDSLPVENANVILMNEETDFWAQEYGQRTTDSNGFIKPAFMNVAEKEYYAIAQKYPSYAESRVFTPDPMQVNDISMIMEIGDGILEIEAVDLDKMPVPFAMAELRQETSELIGTIPLDAEGRATYTTKADKRVYVTVSAEGYTTYSSTAVQILPNETVAVRATLEEEIVGEKPLIRLLGIYNESGKEVTKSLNAGKTYKARLRLAIPSGAEYEELGVFIRAGSLESAEKDKIYINHVNAPNAQQIRGRTYNPPRGVDIDSANLTNGDAKWVEIVWSSEDIVAEIYNIEVEIKVKQETTPGYFLPLFYRAWAVDADGGYLRDPTDSELSLAYETASKNALYAKSYEKDFYEGGETLCDEDFCYSERVLDLSEDLYLTSVPYLVRIFDSYKLEFSITNNSQTVHDNANIRIKNTADGVTVDNVINIQSYKITNADASAFESSEETFEIEPIAAGDFRHNKSITSEMVIQAKKMQQSAIQLLIVSERAQVFDRMIQVKPVKQEDLNVTVKPDVLAAFTDIDLDVHVEIEGNGEEGLEVDNALVKVTRITPDKAKTSQKGYTDLSGNAQFVIPASSPKTKIIIEVEKPGYDSKKITRKVSDKIIQFNPEKIESNLDLTQVTSEEIELEMENLVPVDLRLTNAVIRGDFMGLLDGERMNNWLQQYIEATRIEALESSTIRILTALSDEAWLLDRPEELDGSLILNFSNMDKSITWSLSVPVKVSVDLAQPPKEPNCLTVELQEWKDSTINHRAIVEFSIINACITADDEPMPLRNLQARIGWKGEGRLGEVELTILDPESGNSRTDVLQSGIWTVYFDLVEPEREYIATLVFVPKPGSVGKTAEFEVEIDAELMTSTGRQFVGASNSIEGKIAIVELESCIQFEPEPDEGVIIRAEEDEATLSIDTTACGAIDIDFDLCRHDNGCTGGAEEGEIELMPDKFSLGAMNKTKTVRVRRVTIPGMYGIPVYVRTRGSNYHKIALVDVIVEPNPSEYAFELDKYEFTIKEVGGKDSTELTNSTLTETVEVSATLCDWGDAEEKKDKWFDWRYAGLGAAAGAFTGISKALQATKNQSSNIAKLAGNQLKATQSSFETAAGLMTTATAKVEAALQAAQNAERATATMATACTTSVCGLAESPLVASATAATSAGLSSAGTANAEMISLEAKSQASNTAVQEVSKATLFADPTGVSSTLSTAAGFLTTQVGATATDQAAITGVTAELEAANGAFMTAEEGCTAIEAGCAADPTDATCKTTAADALSANTAAVAKINEAIAAVEAARSGSLLALNTGTATAGSIADAGSKISLAASSAGGIKDSFWGILGLYSLVGFVAGGLLGGLMDEDDACKQRYSNGLTDYIINLAEDRHEIEPDNGLIAAYWDPESLKLIGEFDKQKIGVIFENLGLEEPDPVYSTVAFPATQHLHSDPTRIPRGNDEFGSFNIPDAQTNRNYNEKFHLKFKTSEPIEVLPTVSFDTVACSSGVEIGRTGAGALPKIKLNWSWKEPAGVGIYECDARNEDAVFCDATQFTIMLNKRLNAMYEFLQRNPTMQCPDNTAWQQLQDISADLNVDYSGVEIGCWLDEGDGLYEGIPAIMYYIASNKSTIDWTAAVPDEGTLLDLIYFNAYLIEDGYTYDFIQDFQRYYSEIDFQDTDSYFHRLKTDASGDYYGLDRLFEQERINFTQKYYESNKLPTAGLYQVLINLDFEGDYWRLFNSDDEPAVDIGVVFYHIDDPHPNTPFYSMPFDGLVGLEGDNLNRQGYGTAYENMSTSELMNISEEIQGIKTYNDSGSNPIVFADSAVERSFYKLNVSPSSRGSVLIVEKRRANKANLVLQPARATPVMLKVTQSSIPEDEFSVFYLVKASEVAVDTGSGLAYWDGAGNCLDFSGEMVTNVFFENRDRAAASRDPVVNWTNAYAIDWPSTNYTGDVYLRTIFYTNPLDSTVIQAEQPAQQMYFYTADMAGQAVQINGISSMALNNPGGGSAGTIDSIEDVFDLVRDNVICVSNTGSKAKFWWNPAEIYNAKGKERSIHDQTEGLVAGVNCIGYS